MEVRVRTGFTLIEVVVVVAVIAVIAAITLVSFPEFSERVGIEQEAGKLILALRKAQSYALAVREFQAGSGFFPAYGVNISISDSLHYTIFGDFPENRPPFLGSKRFESFLGEAVETITVEKRVKIKKICGNSQSIPQGSTCNNSSGGLSSADIVYERPVPTISLIGVDGGLPVSYNDIKVDLSSADESIQKSVIIWSTGQISIE